MVKPRYVLPLLFLLNIFIFSSSLTAGFRLEDPSMIDMFDANGKQGLFSAALEAKKDKFRLLEVILCGLMYCAFGHNPVLYHLAGCLLLAFTGFCLYVFVRQVFNWPQLLSFAAAVLFVAHPVNTLTVTSVMSQHINLKNAFLLLACVWAFRQRMGFSLLALVAALCSHETAIMGPLFIVTVFWIKGERWAAAFKQAVPYAAVAVLFYIATHFNAHSIGFIEAFRSSFAVFPQYLSTLAQLFAHYIWLLLNPVGVVSVFSLRIGGGAYLWPSLVLVTVLGIVFMRAAARSPVQLGLLWIAAGLLPVAVACFYGHPGHTDIMIIEPFWLGMCQAGFMIVLGGLAKDLFEAGFKKTAAGFIVALFILWAAATRIYGFIWQDAKVFYLYFLQESPLETGTYCRLAETFMQEGDHITGREYYHKCYEHEPALIKANYYFLLAAADIKEGRMREAEKNWQLSLQNDPQRCESAYNLGLLYYKTKDWPKSKQYFMQTINCPKSSLRQLDKNAQNFLLMMN